MATLHGKSMLEYAGKGSATAPTSAAPVWPEMWQSRAEPCGEPGETAKDASLARYGAKR